MSTGSNAIPLLKAAPEPNQLADRLEGGPWRGIEIALMPHHIASEEALDQAVQAVDGAGAHRPIPSVTAEVPVAWPSGAFVRVDRLDEEGVEGSFRFSAPGCRGRGVTPLIENVPPVLRMRTGGVFLSPIGGHWRDLVAMRERIPALGFTIDTSHAALFRSFATAYPSLFGLASDHEIDLARYVEELGPHAEVAHVSDAHGLLGEGLPYGAGELDLDPIVRRLGELVRYVVAEINEPDPSRSVEMKASYCAIERALETPATPSKVPRRVPTDSFDWQSVLERRDPVPSVLELQEQFGGRRVVLTGGGGSVAHPPRAVL